MGRHKQSLIMNVTHIILSVSYLLCLCGQEEVDAGAIITQESVPVYPGDTEDSLAQRVHAVEHRAFPAALELLASERIELQDDGKLLWK